MDNLLAYMWLLPSGGDLIPLPVVTSIGENNNKAVVNIYPNPAVEVVNINLQLDAPHLLQ